MTSNMSNNLDDTRFSPFVDRVLRRSGWFPGRSVEAEVKRWVSLLKGEFTIFPTAFNVLCEFGGIEVIQDAEGIDFARESFRINPEAGIGEGLRFTNWSAELQTNIYPLGMAVAEHMYLAIAENGEVFLLMDELIRGGADIDNALESLILGRSPDSL